MKRLYIVIFLISSAVLMLEVALTRLFSIYLSYHFAFMVISIAMLGIGTAGTVLSLKKFPSSRTTPERARAGQTDLTDINERLGVYALLAGISVIVGFGVSGHITFDPVKLLWSRAQLFYIALYCLLLSVPFFFSGMLVASAFTLLTEKAERIYGADLIGAGTGSLTVLGILSYTGPEYAVLSASVICFAAAFAAGGRVIKTSSAALIAAVILVSALWPDSITPRLSPYRGLSLALKYPGAEHLQTYYNSFSRIDTLKSPAIRYAPGLSLTYLDPLPEQTGFAIDGGQMNAVTRSDRKEPLRFLESLPSAMPYVLASDSGASKVLVLEPKGGLQALMAEYYGFRDVHKIESNPLVVKIVRDELKDLSGGIYEKNTWTGLGRSYLHDSRFPRSGPGGYDIIDLPMTDVSTTGTFGITEDYRFTSEAFAEYLGALKQDGILSVTFYIVPPPRTELRILWSVLEALGQTGVREISRCVVAVKSWDSIVLLAKKEPFTDEETSRIREFSGEKRFDLLYYHGIREEESGRYVRMPSKEYFTAFRTLFDPAGRSRFADEYLFDVSPVHDENPFFHYHLKFGNLKRIYDVMGQKWQYFMEEGYLLPVIFLQVLALSFVLILLPVLIKGRTREMISGGKGLDVFLYFAMLGLGYMFIEVTLIQKGILCLVSPSYSVATVLTSILISSGAGSLISSRLRVSTCRTFLLMLGPAAVLYSFIMPPLLSLLSHIHLYARIAAVFLALLPLGFLMGTPFPAGIKIVAKRDSALVPWAWAINGCLSVLAPVLTVMIAIVAGFQRVLWLGAGAYLIAYLAMRRMVPPERT